jgi:uncharacterized protein (TIGR02145 family)
MDKIEKLKELKSLLDSGIIDQNEFNQLKGEIIGGVAEKASEKTEGIELEEIIIHGQTWAKSNLDVGTFQNGDFIFEAKSAADWEAAGVQGRPAWCYYDNDPVNGRKYGRLYNWYAVRDPRGLAPIGWHIPSDAEWTTVIENLGGFGTAGTKLKSTSGWNENGNGNNMSGFMAQPCGMRRDEGEFENIGNTGYWWSSDDPAYSVSIYCDMDFMGMSECLKAIGISVRCLRY